jgi:hypothetical protein
MMDPTDQHADVTTPDALRAGRAELRNSLHSSPPPKATQ